MADIVLTYMKADVWSAGTPRLISAPPGTRIVFRDYEHALCDGGDVPGGRDENDEPYEEYVVERKGPDDGAKA